MCHYAQLTFPVPAVILVILSEPLVVVDNVKPPPGFEMVYMFGYLSITIPEPPEPPPSPVPSQPAPPPPVFTVPGCEPAPPPPPSPPTTRPPPPA